MMTWHRDDKKWWIHLNPDVITINQISIRIKRNCKIDITLKDTYIELATGHGLEIIIASFSVDFFTRYQLFIFNHFTLHFSRAHWKTPFSSSSLCNQSWGQCRYWSYGIPSQPQLKTYRSLSQNFPALLASRLLKCSEDHFLCHGIQKEFRNSSHSRCFLAKKHAGHRDTQGRLNRARKNWVQHTRKYFSNQSLYLVTEMLTRYRFQVIFNFSPNLSESGHLLVSVVDAGCLLTGRNHAGRCSLLE